jgi:predicted alpha/beta superfamily hydrolase
MKRLQKLSIVLIWFLSISSLAAKLKPVSGSTHLEAFTLHSQQLNSELKVTLSLPTRYDAGRKYTTLYVLDGQWLMSHALSIRGDLTERNGPAHAPNYIIVGVETPNEMRWSWSMGEHDKFEAFLAKELLPSVDERYSTNGKRLIAGWEATAGASIKILANNPQLFDGYIAASPTPMHGSYFPQLQAEGDAIAAALSTIKYQKFLYIGEAEEDYPAQYGIQNLISYLDENAPQTLNWHHETLTGVKHPDSAYFSLRQALKQYFQHSGPLEVASIAEFKTLGGLKYFDSYYQARAKKLGLEEDEDAKHHTRRHLTLTAIGENDFKFFQKLMNAFASE